MGYNPSHIHQVPGENNMLTFRVFYHSANFITITFYYQQWLPGKEDGSGMVDKSTDSREGLDTGLSMVIVLVFWDNNDIMKGIKRR